MPGKTVDCSVPANAGAPHNNLVRAAVSFAAVVIFAKLAMAFFWRAVETGTSHRFADTAGAAAMAVIAALACVPIFDRYLTERPGRKAMARLRLYGALCFGMTAFLGELLLLSFMPGLSGNAWSGMAEAGLLVIVTVPAGLRILWALGGKAAAGRGIIAASPYTGIFLTAATTVLLTGFLIAGDALKRWRYHDAERAYAQMLASGGSASALGERAGRQAALLAFAAEPAQERAALELRETLADLRRETDRFGTLWAAARSSPGADTSADAVADSVDPQRDDLIAAAERLLGQAKGTGDGGRASGTMQHATDRFLSAIASEMAELRLRADSEAWNRKRDMAVSFVVAPLVLLALIFSVAVPAVSIARDRNRRMVSARNKALRTFADLEAYRIALEQHYTVARVRPTGEVIYVNDRFCAVSGYSRPELIGKSLRVLDSGIHDKAFFANIFRTAQGRQTWCGEICSRAKDGGLYWDDTVVFPIIGKTGEIEQFVLICAGITDRKRTEHALAQANATLQAFMKHAPVCVAMFDREMRYIAITDQWKKEFGVLSDPTGKCHYDEFPGTPERRRAMHRLCLDGDVICVEEEDIELLDGGVHTHRWEGRPWFQGDGSIGGIVIMTDNIASRKTAESALRASEERFRSLFLLSPVGVVLADAATSRLLLASEVMSQITGYSIAELQDLNFNALTPPEHRQLTDEQFAILKKTRKIGPVEKEYIRKDGSRVPVVINAVALGDGETQDLCLAVVQDITARRATEDKLWQLANIDALTGLPGRRLFHENLAQAIASAERRGSVVAVGLIDLDNFKEVNDSFGHDAGDLLLKTVAERLSGAVRATDTIARLGGDEFAFILSDAHQALDISRPIEAIFAAMSAPIAIGGTLRRCTLSVGVTVFPQDAAVAKELITNADIALYRAKALGRNRAEYFTPSLRIEIERRQALRQEFEDALRSESLTLFYQPIVSLAENRVTACEALLRVRHPKRGLLGPEDFLGVFDDPGLAASAGERMLEMALEQMCEWRNQGIVIPKISMNVSVANFRTGRFAEELAAQLAWHEIEPSNIAIELTEAMLVGRGADTARQTLDRLRRLGVEIYLDDFGTGFASLADLRKLPVDCLKIDRSFVSTMEDNDSNASIVKAVIQLGHSLGMTVTAEGVENEAQLEALGSLGCDRVQGFAVARPMPAAKVAAYLQRAAEVPHAKGRPARSPQLALKRSNF